MMEGMGYNLDPNMLVNALTCRDNNNNGGLAEGGLLWIFLLILFGGFGGYGNGIGGRGEGALINDGAITGQIESALNAAQAKGCSDQLILEAISGNKEAINSIGSYLGMEVGKVQSAISGLERGICELGYRTSQDTASVIQAVSSGNCELSRQLADCCCATQRAIDGVNYNMATGFASIQNNMDKSFCALEREVERKIDVQSMEMRTGFQGLRDYMVQEKMEALQSELNQYQLQLSQTTQTQNLKDFIAETYGCCGCPCAGLVPTPLLATK